MFLHTSLYGPGGYFCSFLLSNSIWITSLSTEYCIFFSALNIRLVIGFFFSFFPFTLLSFIWSVQLRRFLVFTCTSVSPFPFCDYNITWFLLHFNMRIIQTYIGVFCLKGRIWSVDIKNRWQRRYFYVMMIMLRCCFCTVFYFSHNKDSLLQQTMTESLLFTICFQHTHKR